MNKSVMKKLNAIAFELPEMEKKNNEGIKKVVWVNELKREYKAGGWAQVDLFVRGILTHVANEKALAETFRTNVEEAKIELLNDISRTSNLDELRELDNYFQKIKKHFALIDAQYIHSKIGQRKTELENKEATVIKL